MGICPYIPLLASLPNTLKPLTSANSLMAAGSEPFLPSPRMIHNGKAVVVVSAMLKDNQRENGHALVAGAIGTQ